MLKADLFDQIIDPENIKDAYLEVYGNFLKKSAIFDYDVIDGVQIHQTEVDLPKFLGQIRDELVDAVKPRLARSIAIPKKNGKLRKIYMVPVKERVKCQAIYRVMQIHLKPTYSNKLFSFRSERPSYYALRSLRRFYLGHVNKGYHLLKTDFKDYSDHIDKKILLEKLKGLGVDEKTLNLTRQYIEMPFIRNGEIMSMAEGTMQGVPLVSLFNNVYMSQVDEVLGSQVEFYRRVGDDVIAIDTDLKKLEKLMLYVREQCKEMKIILNESKTALKPMEEGFEYLGLYFDHGKASIPPAGVKKMITELKIFFPSKSKMSSKAKLARIQRILLVNARGRSALWNNYAGAYGMMTDMKQLQNISVQMMKILWAYLGNGFTAKRMADGKKMMTKARLNLNTFFDHYKDLFWPHLKPVKKSWFRKVIGR